MRKQKEPGSGFTIDEATGPRALEQFKTGEGGFSLTTLRDRRGNFEPQIVKKRETVLADNLEERTLVCTG